MRDVRSHYIRKNESARVPDRYVILDAESIRERSKSGEVQTWSLACVNFITWTKTGRVQEQESRYDTPEDLWRAVSTFTRVKRRTVLYAHNLNYDLRISQALSYLPSLGWTLQDMRLDGRGSWSRWTRQSASLLLCDSASIYPVKLAKLATEIGMVKPPLPTSDDREALFRRCEADVRILSRAMILYLRWLKSGACGNWQMTGASQSWSHFRHSLMPYPILVHDNEDALAAERRAMHAGRAEAWKWGDIKKEKLWEYDWSNSYPRIAHDCLLPQSYFGTLAAPSIERLEALWSKYCVLADVEITTDVPCVPANHDGRTVWPVGVFQTTLWDPELRELRKANATVRVLRAWLYKRAPILKDWAQWILSSLHDSTPITPQWQKLILKHWSRSLVGRFGMRYRAWEKFATAPNQNITTSIFYNSDTGEKSELMQIGSSIFKLGEIREVSDGCPQVTSYIMSEARAKLWRVVSDVGYSRLYYMDTDSLVVSHPGHVAIQSRNGEGDYAGLRSKGTYLSARIYGPRSAIFGGTPSVAGMPRDSVEIDRSRFRGEVWRGCQESLSRGEYDRVIVSCRNFTLRNNEHRRAFCDDNSTVPYELPAFTPAAGYVPPRTRLERAILNGYPAMLSRSTSRKPRARARTG
jgi:hypothetical protein